MRFVSSVAVLIVLGGGLAFAPAHAQPTPLPSRSKPVPAGEKMLACPEYGPGFFRQQGSSTCLRISGQVRGEAGVRQRGSALQDSTGFNSRVRVMLDARTPTELGTLRLVFRGDGKSGHNWMNR